MNIFEYYNYTLLIIYYINKMGLVVDEKKCEFELIQDARFEFQLQKFSQMILLLANLLLLRFVIANVSVFIN